MERSLPWQKVGGKLVQQIVQTELKKFTDVCVGRSVEGKGEGCRGREIDRERERGGSA